ncbi:MAG: protein kinase [Polyangiaceae bacterium]|nr:protein kinase [Polyangiaceae bacterium]
MNADVTRTAAGQEAEISSPTDAPRPTLEATYHLERVIASGGMGVVLAAKHKHLGTRVAIKVLHDTSPALKQRFLREARLVASLESPFIVRVRDYGFAEDGQPFLVMDLVSGRTLKARIREQALSSEEAARLATELTRALIVAHDLGIVHRDIKPANILLSCGDDDLEHVRLIDFGIAKRMRGDTDTHDSDDLTKTNEILGTAAYMAPEQMVEAKVVDARADVFSVGAVLYEMLTGKPALRHDTRAYQLAMSAGRAATEPITPIGSIVEGVPGSLEAIVLRCLSIKPEERFDSARSLLAALLAYPNDTGITSAPALPSAQASPELEPMDASVVGASRRPHRWIGAMVALACVGGGVWFFARSVMPSEEPTKAQDLPDDTQSSALVSANQPVVVAPVTAASPPEPSQSAPAQSGTAMATTKLTPMITATPGHAARPPRAPSTPKPSEEKKGPRFDTRK